MRGVLLCVKPIGSCRRTGERGRVFLFRGGRSIGVVRDLAKVQAWVRVPSTAPYLQITTQTDPHSDIHVRPSGFSCIESVEICPERLPRERAQRGQGETMPTANGSSLPERETRRMRGYQDLPLAPAIPTRRRCGRFVRALRAIPLHQNGRLREPA